MTDQLAPLRSVLDEAFADYDDTAVIDLQPVSETVIFTPGLLRQNGGWVPSVGRAPIDYDLPLAVFEQVDAAFRWRTPKGRLSRRRGGYDAHMAAHRRALDGAL